MREERFVPCPFYPGKACKENICKSFPDTRDHYRDNFERMLEMARVLGLRSAEIRVTPKEIIDMLDKQARQDPVGCEIRFQELAHSESAKVLAKCPFFDPKHIKPMGKG